MRFIVLALALLGALAAPCRAGDVPFSALPLAASVGGTERIVSVQGAGCAASAMPCNNVVMTPSQIATYAATSPPFTSQYQPLDCDLTSIATASATGLFYRSAACTWAAVTLSGHLSLSGGTLDIAGALLAGNSLSDVGSVTTARSNLGLGSAATNAATAFAPAYAFTSGRWYIAETMTPGTAGTGAAFTANQIHMAIGRIRSSVTAAGLGAYIATAAASGNCQLAIYAASPSTLMPTGAPIASTSSLSTAATGTISATLSAFTLTQGLYWFATNCDNSTVVLSVVNAAQAGQVALVGTASLQYATQNGVALGGLSKSQTFGTWPTLTGSYSADGLSDLNGQQTTPVVAFKTQ